MKQKMRYILSTILLMVTISISAQEGLYIGDIFEHYGKRHGSTMVQLSADVLKPYDITLYKSLSFRPDASGPYNWTWIMACVDQDKHRAKKIKETVFDGNLKSGYYQLPKTKKGINRLILLKPADKGKRATLIYIEGTLNSAELVSMLFSKK